MSENSNEVYDDEVEEIENPCPICGNELEDSLIECTECEYLANGYQRCVLCGTIFDEDRDYCPNPSCEYPTED